MEKKKVCFFADGDFNIGSYRIPFVWIKKILLEKGFDCKESKIDSSIDIYICKGGQNIASMIRSKNPKAYIILFKPHCEIEIDLSLKNPIKFIYRFLYFISEFVLQTKQKSFVRDIIASDLLVADSKKLKLFLEANYNKKVIYMRLLEKIKPKKKFLNKKIKDKLIFLYHGSIKHYNESYPTLIKLLELAALHKQVNFICIANLADIQKKINLRNVKSDYYEYSFETLIKYLEIANIGFVPNFLRPRIPFLIDLYNLFNFKSYQLNLYTKSEKNSSNAGRAYLFAAYGIPFIAHPTREIIADFNTCEGICFPNDDKEAEYYLKKLIKDQDYYSRISKNLISISNLFNLEIEVEKLIEEIRKQK